MPVVVVTGVAGALGRRVVERLAETDTWSVVGLDRLPFPSGVAKPRHFRVHRVNLDSAPLEQLFAGADALIHLSTVGPDHDDAVSSDALVLDRTLRAASVVGIRSVVLLSSAVVYGARPDNAVPLTETSACRADPSFVYAAQKMECESTAQRWREGHDDASVAVLRPATTLGHPDARAWLADAVRPGLAERLTSTLPATQFVHIDDVADAVVHALVAHLDGVFNVSSDDWLNSEAAHALFGPTLGFPVPDRAVEPVRRFADLLTGRRRPIGALPFSQHPWVVANDRLRASGWVPRSSSAEAFVAAKPPSVVGRLYARRRQEVTLAVVALLALLGIGAVTVFARRLLSRSRGSR